FTALVRGAVAGWGGQRAWGTISGRVFAALADTEGVVASSRRGLLRRCADELDDLQRTRARLRAVEADMAAVLSELGLSRPAAIQAETGSRQATAAAAAARARRAKARVACAASLLRWIYSLVVHSTSWDPDVASGTSACPAEAA